MIRKNKKKLIAASCILFTSLSLTACTTNTTNNTTENKGSATEENVSKEYETEDVRITNPDDALKRLKEGQHPYAVIVSCFDSRVTPTTVFNAGLGVIFDIRIAGNVVDDKAHNNAHAEGNIEDLVEKILPSVKNAKDIDEGIHSNIDNVAKEIQNDAIVKHLVDQGKVKVVRAYYSLDGKVTFME